jgi:peptidyl-dipeptidase A
MLPVQLLGNMWGQDWSNIADIALPPVAPGSGASADLTAILKARNTTPVDMFRMGERFYTSLGFDSLPATFWERSLFARPRDRDVVCHASAWYVDDLTDLRVKMCTEPTEDAFRVLHHELGHDFYFRAYKDQPYLYQAGANDGFHEAIGDAIALSVTPRYLQQIGLFDSVPAPSGDTLQLLLRALDHVAFLPFGITIDKWRWEVFAGKVPPADYTKRWWELRGAYGGVMPPIARAPTDFDPGAKYHVPGNVPYMRYFLAQVLEFQFYRSLCHAASVTGPLYRCSYYGSKQAGERLAAMLQLGASRPWPDALEALTGQREMDATALLDYFQPLMVWLERENRGAPTGW